MNIKGILRCITLLFVLLLPYSCYGAEQVVKVGFIPDGNFYHLDSYGNMSGYNYDYLQKVAQYTNWDYEFVLIEEENLDFAYEVARNMLQAGELDLLGSHSRNSALEEIFEYGECYYGVVRSTLCTLANNNLITKNNFFQQETLRAGLISSGLGNIEYFHEIMERYNISPVVTYVDTQEEAVVLLVDEKVDVVMSTDFSVLHDSLMILESANPNPLYFVSTKGNSGLMEQLDMAIRNIETTNSSVIDKLQEKYFSSGHRGDLIRTNAENVALMDYEYLTIGLLKDKEPYQFFREEQEGEEVVVSGISVEILELISGIIDVEFRYVWGDTAEELVEKVEREEIDFFATLSTDYQLARSLGLMLTDPYVSTGAVLLRRMGSGAMYKDAYYHFVSDIIPFYSADQLTMVESIPVVLEDISKNGNKILFSDSYVAQYYLQKQKITNVEVQSVSNLMSNVSLGVGQHVDPVIIGLINHAILHLNDYEVDEIIYRNMIVNEGITLSAFLKEHAYRILWGVTGVMTVIVVCLFYYARKFRLLSQRDSLTKVQNAGYFHQYAEEKTKKLNHGCLMLVDIDYFKKVNDTYGHQMGDAVIQEVSQTLANNFRTSDVVGRLGGDEFAILIEGECSISVLEEKCRQILARLIHSDSGVPITLSIGGCVFTKPVEYESLYRVADGVLYQVKEAGRNGYQFTQCDVTVPTL